MMRGRPPELSKMWRVFDPRQITGLPYRYYGYIGRDRREQHCCETGKPPGSHGSGPAAIQCAMRAAEKKNKKEAATGAAALALEAFYR
jgi:hypothetical protein